MTAEQRQTPREGTIANEVRTLAELPGGTILEGCVADVSLGGARVQGPAVRLRVGDGIRLVFVFTSDERVAYDCEVRHVDPAGKFFGVKFRSEPKPINVNRA